MCSQEAENYSITLKILLNGLQFNSVAGRLEYEWPAFLHSMFSSFQVASEPGAVLLSPDCYLGGSAFYLACVLNEVLPVAVVMFVSAGWLLIGQVYKMLGKAAPSKYTLYSGIVTSLLLLYPSICSKSFQMLACTPAGLSLETGERFDVMTYDDSVECFSSEHVNQWILPIFLPVFIVIVVGLPVFLSFLVRANAVVSMYGSLK